MNKFFSIRLSGRNIALSVILFFVFSYIAVAIGLTYSPSIRIDAIQNSYDVRLSGLTEQGWSTPDFTFNEERISAAFAKIKLVFREAKNSSAEVPRMEFFQNEISLGQEIASGPVFLNLAAGQIFQARPGINFKAKSINPFKSGSEEGRTLGAKISSITVIPRFFLLAPTLTFAIWPLILTAIFLGLLTALTFNREKLTFNLLPALLATGCCSYILTVNRLDYWARCYWLWVFIILLLSGILLFQLIFKRPDTAERAPSELKKLSSSYYFALIAILLLATFLRFNGLNFGLPGFFHPDEGRKIRIARSMVESGDLNPHYFRHPSFLLYATAANTYVASVIKGKIPKLSEVAYLGRSVSATLGSLSVIVLFMIGMALFGPLAGLTAAALLAVSPLHIVCSRYIKEDAAMLFFTLLCVYFAILALKRGGNLRLALYSAFFAGVSASCKYSGLLNIVFALLPLGERLVATMQKFFPSLTALLQRVRYSEQTQSLSFSSFSTHLLSVLIVFACGYFIISPYALLDSDKFIYDFMGEKVHMERGHTVPITAASYYWTYHFRFSVIEAISYCASLLSILALGFVVARGRAVDYFVFTACLMFYLPAEWVNAKPQPQPERYILPCVPFLCLALGSLTASCLTAAKKVKFGHTVQVLACILLTVGFFQALIFSFGHSQSIKNDTRLQAREWVVKNIPAHTKLLIDWKYYAPPRILETYDILELKDKGGAKLLRGISAESFKASGYDYLIISSFTFGRFLDPLYRTHNLSKRFKAFFDKVKPVAVFEDDYYSYGFHNPTIWIFSLKDIT